MFFIRKNTVLSISDEGYFWYGAQRTFEGDVPLRDFQSYAPARYYWSAAWFHLAGSGIFSLRFSETLFQIFALFLALLAAQRMRPHFGQTAGIGALLCLWMYPDYKYFDCAMPLIAVYVGFRLWENPTPSICGFTGVFVGLSSLMGFNHGLYLGLSFSVIFWVVCRRWGGWKARVGPCLAGFLIGCFPYLVMCLGVKGFGRAFFTTLGGFLKTGAYLSVPIPWPWSFPILQAPNPFTTSHFLIGFLYVLIPPAYAFWLFKRFTRKAQDPLFETYSWICAVIGIPYLHYLFGRADIYHLAVGVSPFWMGGFMAASKRKSAVGMVLIFGIAYSFFSIGALSDLKGGLEPVSDSVLKYPLGRDSVFLNRSTVGIIEGLKKAISQREPHQSVLFYPHLPGLYCVFGEKSPVWEVYPVFPPTPEQERELVAEVEKNNVRWCLIDTEGLDGRSDLSFGNSHRVLGAYLSQQYRMIPPAAFSLPPYVVLFYKKGT